MRILNFKENFFTYDGKNLNKATTFLNGILADLKIEIRELTAPADLLEGMENCQKYIKSLESGAVKLEAGKEYRLLSEVADFAFKNGSLYIFNICDECGTLYRQDSNGYNTELKNTNGRNRWSHPLGKDGKKFYCGNCRFFNPTAGSTKSYIPTANRTIKKVDLITPKGELRGKIDVVLSKYSNINIEDYFCFMFDDTAPEVVESIYKKADYLLEQGFKHQKIDGVAEGYKRIPAPDRNALHCVSEFRTSFLDRLEKFKKSVEEESFYDNAFLKKGNIFIEYKTIDEVYLRENGEDIFLSGEEAYKFLNNGYKKCPYCGRFYRLNSDEVKALEDVDEIEATAFRGEYDVLCIKCINNRKHDPYKIFSYSTRFDEVIPHKKQFVKKGFYPQYLYYGVELEANTKGGPREDIVRKILTRLNGYVFAKRDGSLDQNTGIELVSTPATFNKCREIWSNLFNKKYSRTDSEDLSCSDLSAYNDPKCGLHIHISRSVLKDRDICHIVFFINRFRSFCAKIAGREYWRNDYALTKNINGGNDEVKMANSCLYSCNGHYDAVNIRNTNTIEIRIFKANVTMSAFFRYLEFVDALVQYSFTLKALLFKNFTPFDFLPFVAENKNKYKFLNDFIEKNKNFFKEEKINSYKIKKELAR